MSAVKSFFSGVEGQQHYDACLHAGVEHVLMSYMYLQKKNPDLIKLRKKANPEVKFMIDSGAHTVISDYAKFASWTKQDFENYVSEYCRWLLNNKDYIYSAVEFDIDYALNMIFGTSTGAGVSTSTVGPEMVKEWQKKYFLPLQEKGINIIFVWHTERKVEGWEEMCAKFPYCGLPGEMSSDPDFNKYITVARRYLTKVHGFGATKQTDFRDWPWFSIDSTTWKSCEIYGTLIHWDEHKQLLTYDQDKRNRANYRAYFEKYKLDADAIIRDTNYKEVTRYALCAMRAMEKFYEERYKDRLAYYEVRLPHPNRVLDVNFPQKEVWQLWRNLRPSELFAKQSAEQNISKVRRYLHALACVQYCAQDLLGASDVSFLTDNFPKLMTPQAADPVVFQKELAVYLSPPAPSAIPRTQADQYVPANNPPRKRLELTLKAEDIEFDIDPSSLPEI